ncbi:MAG: hypothetical protein ACKVU1_14980 [bacterium]
MIAIARRIVLALIIAAIAAALAPAGARAIEARIDGTLENATSGGPAHADYVRLLRLKTGMEQIAVIEDVTGSFQFSGITGEINDPYLVQVSSGSVNYNESVTLDATGIASLNIAVYDTTSSLADVRVVKYQIGLAVESQLLRVFKVAEIMVEGDPPRAVVIEPGAFRFPVQSALVKMGTATAQYATMPLSVDPVRVGDGSEYAISYPLRPGKTELQIQYDLEYDEAGTVFSEAIAYAVDEINALVVPESIAVVSDVLSDRGLDPQNGIHLFSGLDIPAGTAITLRLSGKGASASPHPEMDEGAGEGAGAEGGMGGERSRGRSGGGGDRVVHVPNRMNSIRTPVIAGVLGTLLLGAAYALTRPATAGGEAGSGQRTSDPVFLARREQILDRIVALDAKHRAGEISEYAYWQKREALKDLLVEIIEEAARSKRVKM